MLLRRRRYSLTNKDNLSLDIAIVSFSRQVKIAKMVGSCLAAVCRDFQRTLRCIGFAGDHLKRLQKTAIIACALEAVSFKMSCQITRGNGEARRERIAATQFLRRQEFQMHA